ncbi:hypothetical protein SNE40_007394 [Patella caerulea]|uniref:TRPM3 n=1 Tax=Patella caerulea TaxID=87958 RepID=A0AAN8K5U8_PATCE
MASSGGWRVHPADEMNISAINYGGPSMSKMSYSESQDPYRYRSSTLEDAKWSDMRKKTGLPRFTKEVLEAPIDNKIEAQTRYIRENFHQKECTRFVPKPQPKETKVRDLKCNCGEILSNHAGFHETAPHFNPDQDFSQSHLIKDPAIGKLIQQGNSSLPIELPDIKWNAEESLAKSITTSFGKIHFKVEQIGGRKPSKYVRVTEDDNVRNVLKLMEDHWRIMDPRPPNLVISVIGGAKNFRLDGRMRETFSTGLIKAAKTTSAWLITSGFNMGVMKSVGQAVNEGQTFLWDNDRMTHLIRCIGIAPWGYIRGRDALVGDGAGNFRASYKPSNVILHGKPVPLNPDHTHFIFVDDGMRNRYGGVADFRAKFEKIVSRPRTDGGLGIPVVLVVVEGGTDAITDAKRSLDEGTPVVVCAGTGRAADILAYAYKHTKRKGEKRHLKKKYKKKLCSYILDSYGKSWKDDKKDEEVRKYLELVEECCLREDLMIIFHMNKHEDLDLAILSVLLKAKKDGHNSNNKKRLENLKLAMTWNRADIAQREIFGEDVNWNQGALDDTMTTAILEDKVDFIKLLLDQGVCMKEYLTVERLKDFYNKIPKHSHLYILLKRTTRNKEEFDLQDIGSFLKSFLDKFEDDKFSAKPTKKATQYNKSVIPHSSRSTGSDDDFTENSFKCPYKQLLIWSVLMNRSQMSIFFWEMGQEPITSAIAATRLCDGMIVKLPKYQNDLREDFAAAKDTFEELATKVLDECQSVDPDKAMMLVERKSPMWSDMTCLQMAAVAKDQLFLSSVGCQYAINHTWKHGILSSWRRVGTAVLLPFLILTRFMELSDMGEKRKVKWYEKLQIFYTAPITKFTYYTVSYLIFLSLFSYMVLVDYTVTPSVTEYICFCWIITFLVGEIHSFLAYPSPTMYGKVRDWYGFLNRMDLVNLILSIIAFILRWDPAYYTAGKTIYCINVVVFYIRILRVYIANRSLGPKLFMILKMFEELVMFCFVLFVFLLAYGVASQGLLFKARHSSNFNIVDIVYYPYWQLYGELFLEEIQTDEACTAALSNATSLLPSNNTCRTYNPLVPILLAGYLLVGNVLLLNLLIAIFSHVFDTVEQKSLEIWKYQMYFLVSQYDIKTGFFPPFSIIVHMGLLVKWILRKTCCVKQFEGIQYQAHHHVYLQLFEKEMMANFLRRRKDGEMDSMDTKLSTLQKRVDDLTKLIEDEIVADDESDDDFPALETQDTVVMDDKLKWPEVERVLEMDKRDKMIDDLIAEDSKTDEPKSQKFEDVAMEEVKKKHKKKKKKKDKKKKEETDIQENIFDEDMDQKLLTNKKMDKEVLPMNLAPDSPIRNMNSLSSKISFSPVRNNSMFSKSNDTDSEDDIPRDKMGRKISPNIKSRASFLEFLSDSSDEDNISSRRKKGRKLAKQKRRDREYEEKLMDVEDRMEQMVRSNQETFQAMKSMLEKTNQK